MYVYVCVCLSGYDLSHVQGHTPDLQHLKSMSPIVKMLIFGLVVKGMLRVRFRQVVMGRVSLQDMNVNLFKLCE